MNNVLVLGYRRGLINALNKAGLTYALWDPVRDKAPGAAAVLRRPMPLSAAAARKTAAEFSPWGPFSHVIAAGESSVYPASHARRVLGARLSKHSVVKSCSDKVVMKGILADQGIPMTPFMAGPRTLNAEQIFAQWPKVVLKTARSSGGRGMQFISRGEELPTFLESGQLLEKFVDAPECSIESFVHNGRVLFANITEYYRKRHTNILPAAYHSDLTNQLLALNQRVIGALKLSWGMTHLEIYLGAQGPLFGEIALRPPGGYIMDLLSKAYDFDAWRAFLDIELGHEFHFPDPMPHNAEKLRNLQGLGHAPSLQAPKSHNIKPYAVTVLHPGQGQVKKISGWDRLTKDPSVTRAKLKVKVGDVIDRRDGAGEDIGYIFQTADNRAQLVTAIERIQGQLHLELS